MLFQPEPEKVTGSEITKISLIDHSRNGGTIENTAPQPKGYQRPQPVRVQVNPATVPYRPRPSPAPRIQPPRPYNPQPRPQPQPQPYVQRPTVRANHGSLSLTSFQLNLPYQPQQPRYPQPAPYQPRPAPFVPFQPLQQRPSPSGCCGGQLFSQQGGLCMPISFNPCQQQNNCGGSGGCGGCGGGSSCGGGCGGGGNCGGGCGSSCGGGGGSGCGGCGGGCSPSCCQPQTSACCNQAVSTCCQPQQMPCCNQQVSKKVVAHNHFVAQVQTCCPPPVQQSCCCPQPSSICRHKRYWKVIKQNWNKNLGHSDMPWEYASVEEKHKSKCRKSLISACKRSFAANYLFVSTVTYPLIYIALRRTVNCSGPPVLILRFSQFLSVSHMFCQFYLSRSVWIKLKNFQLRYNHCFVSWSVRVVTKSFWASWNVPETKNREDFQQVETRKEEQFQDRGKPLWPSRNPLWLSMSINSATTSRKTRPGCCTHCDAAKVFSVRTLSGWRLGTSSIRPFFNDADSYLVHSEFETTSFPNKKSVKSKSRWHSFRGFSSSPPRTRRQLS